MNRVGRAVAVTAVITTADLAGVLALRRRARLPLVVADAAAVTLTSAASWALHRRITLRNDPYAQWIDERAAFVTTAAVTGAVDVAVTSALGRDGDLVGAKLAGISAAAAVRLVAYRSLLFTATRRTQARRQERPLPAGRCRLTVVVPAYEEEERISGAVARIAEALEGIEAEILVVDDGSRDATAVRARDAGARVVRLERNHGKGAAVRAGVLAAEGSVIAFTDADLAYPPTQLRALLTEVEDGWDVVVGSRRHPASTGPGDGSALRDVSGRLFNLLTATVLLGQYRDTQCGLKAFRADVARRVFGVARVDSFAFDVELLHLVERFRLSLREVPVTLEVAEGSTVHLAVDALGMVRDLFRVRRWAASGAYDVP